MQKSGLYLKDDVIHRISGPMSMFYLRPRPTGKLFGVNGIRPDLPLVMLWGDRHRDDSKMCLDCDCKLPENCCHLTYDKEFLKKLDKMAEDHPIDFYTEYSQTMDHLGSGSEKNILFKKFLKNTTATCHKKELRSRKAYRDCPTTFMRWHYSDTRFMNNTIEYYIDRSVQLTRFMDDLIAFHNTHAHTINQLETNEHLQKWNNLMADIRDHIYDMNQLSNNDPHIELFKKGNEIYIDMLKILLTPYSSYKQDSRDKNLHMKYKKLFSVWVDAIIDSKTSVFYKQLSQLNLPHLLEQEWLVTLLTDLFLNVNYNQHAINDKGYPLDEPEEWINQTDINYSKLITSIFISIQYKELGVDNRGWSSFIKNIIRAPDYTFEVMINTLYHFLNILSDMFIPIHAIWVDLYMVARMLKPPKGNSPPLLAYGYFGAAHCRGIVRLLTDPRYFNYELVYKNINMENKIYPPFRCLVIDKPIYLYNDLVRHAESQHKYRTNKGYINAYQRVKEQERIGREQNLENEVDPIHPNSSFKGGRRTKNGKTNRVKKSRVKTRKIRKYQIVFS